MPLNIKDELHRKLIIAVDGVAPGVGKTTVMRHVVASPIGRGTDVMAFAEEDVLTHPALADVAHEFAAVGRVSPETLLDASAQYFRWFADAEEEVAVVDALFPFVASLLGWGRDEREIYAFTSRLRVLPGAESIRFVYLDADPRAALQRASAREANGWLEWLISTLGDAPGGTVGDLESLCEYLVRRRELTLRLLTGQGWQVTYVGDALAVSAEQIADQVLTSVVL